MLLSAIQDEVDDVRAVTASCLLPVVDKLPDVMPDKVFTLEFFIQSYCCFFVVIHVTSLFRLYK